MRIEGWGKFRMVRQAHHGFRICGRKARLPSFAKASDFASAVAEASVFAKATPDRMADKKATADRRRKINHE